jgi:hypothetical protein
LTTTEQQRILPNRGELPDFLLTVVRRLCIEQGFVYERRGKHNRVYAPDGQWCTLPSTLFDGPVRHKYLANLRRIGADLSFPKTVRPSSQAAAMPAFSDTETIDRPWTDTEWRELQRASEVWWRRELAGPARESADSAPEPGPSSDSEPNPQVSASGLALLSRLEAGAKMEPRRDAPGDGRYTLAAARQMLRDGYSLAHVTRRTGWGRMWLEDLAARIEQGG